jgi:hypothetical protein
MCPKFGIIPTNRDTCYSLGAEHGVASNNYSMALRAHLGLQLHALRIQRNAHLHTRMRETPEKEEIGRTLTFLMSMNEVKKFPPTVTCCESESMSTCETA